MLHGEMMVEHNVFALHHLFQSSVVLVSQFLRVLLFFTRTFQDLSACPGQRRWEYRSWRPGPRSLFGGVIGQNFCEVCFLGSDRKGARVALGRSDLTEQRLCFLLIESDQGL